MDYQDATPRSNVVAHEALVGAQEDNLQNQVEESEQNSVIHRAPDGEGPEESAVISEDQHNIESENPAVEEGPVLVDDPIQDEIEDERLQDGNQVEMEEDNEESRHSEASSEAEDVEYAEQDEEMEEEETDEEDGDEDDHRVVRIRNLLLQLPRLPRMVFQRLRRHHIFGNIQFRELEDTPESDDEGQQEAKRPKNITFDQNLPTSHSYLGEMDECSGIQYIDEESFVVLPILRVPDFILVPGQTMPLNVTRPQDVALLKSVLAREDKTFGVIMLRNAYGIGSPSTIDFGCTAELRSMREEEVYEIQTMVGIAIGRQRFKIMETRPQPDGNIVAKVQILADDELSPPASGASLAVQRKLHIPPAKKTRRRHLQHSDRMNPGWFTRCPPWLYNMYDVRILRKLLINELKDWNPELDEKTLPASPSAFSFWIASHLLITNVMRLFLLKIECSIQRLRCELDLLRKCTVYACINCGNQITQKQHLFNMSVSGPMDAYVNPSGHIHETLTVYITQGLKRVSRPSTEHSWFPGYAWTICECASCSRHMGWKFTATREHLTPGKFWGLTRSSLAPKVEVEEFEERPEGVPTHRRRLTSDSSSVSSGSSISSPYADLNWRPMM